LLGVKKVPLSNYKINTLLINSEGIGDKLLAIFERLLYYFNLTGKASIEQRHYGVTYYMDCYCNRLRLTITKRDRSGWRDRNRRYVFRAHENHGKWTDIERVDREVLFELSLFKIILKDAVSRAEEEVLILKAEAEAIAEVM
jgi:hypothetical protein